MSLFIPTFYRYPGKCHDTLWQGRARLHDAARTSPFESERVGVKKRPHKNNNKDENKMSQESKRKKQALEQVNEGDVPI